MNRIYCESLLDCYSKLNYFDLERMAYFLGKLLKNLHELNVEKLKFMNISWSPFIEFMKIQRRKIIQNYQKWKVLPYYLLNQLETYLPSIETLENVLLTQDKPKLLHGDITNENLLISFQNKEMNENYKKMKNELIELLNNNNISWKCIYLIDFGDAQFGDIVYEFIPLHISVFRCNKQLLKIFLKSYDFSNLENFPYKAMCLTLLHPSDAMSSVYYWKPNLRKFHNFNDLATELWDISKIE